MKYQELTKAMIGCAFKVHQKLGNGYLEKIYENALRIELDKQGMVIQQQKSVSVCYDGQILVITLPIS
ncbi:MAG: GxxExxY protein [Anaerolineales bacterium]|nr:GxxExxY protein [Anaerolineales bacterium]